MYPDASMAELYSVKPDQVPKCLLLSSPIVLLLFYYLSAQEQEHKSKGQYPVHRGV